MEHLLSGGSGGGYPRVEEPKAAMPVTRVFVFVKRGFCQV